MVRSRFARSAPAHIDLAPGSPAPLALTRITLDHNGRLEERLVIAWHPAWAREFFFDLDGLLASLDAIVIDQEFGP
jgi:hypothetical protein